MILGTSHFVSLLAAAEYYRTQGFGFRDVLRKLQAGEIHIGRPYLKHGEHLIRVDNETRYAVVKEG